MGTACTGGGFGRRGAVMGTTRRMGSIRRIISSTASGAFVLVLLGLIGTIWFAPAHDLDGATGLGRHLQRIELRNAAPFDGYSAPSETDSAPIPVPPHATPVYLPSTQLNNGQINYSLAASGTVPFRQTQSYITTVEDIKDGTSGDRGADYKAVGYLFLLTTLIFLASSFDLRSQPFSRAQKLVLSGIAASFLLYLLGIVTEGLSKAELMYPATAACLPVLVGGFTGLITLLQREDG